MKSWTALVDEQAGLLRRLETLLTELDANRTARLCFVRFVEDGDRACVEAEGRVLVLPMVNENDGKPKKAKVGKAKGPPRMFVLPSPPGTIVQDEKKLSLEGETATGSVDREVVHKSGVRRL